PTPPDILGEILRTYAATDRPAVVDLGSGTGLSSRWAARWANTVVGIEPSDDMRRLAESQTDAPNVRYVDGWAHATGLEAGYADVVIASQSLHWMEPTSTLAEVARLLRVGGVFAAIDCDFPPTVGSAAAEQAWTACRARVKAFDDRLASGVRGDDLQQPLGDVPPLPPEFIRDAPRGRVRSVGVTSWSKDEHLDRFIASGHFRWCREIESHHVDEGDAERFVALLLSQGDFQTLKKHGVDESLVGVDELRSTTRDAFGAVPRPFWWSYRTRIGVR
ncbi:MAG TPA: class I SAM-dependent methyltransferase, partial [Acidimicrobiales bacterium]|nr:class I SAM-dependent methyltransferase [Acidimicrobiales bacterium]